MCAQAVCLHEQTLRHIYCFERNRKSLVLFVVVDSEDSDWLAWLYPSPYTAAHRFGIVIMALDGVFMRVDVNDNFFENDVVCTMLLLKTEGRGNICFCKYLIFQNPSRLIAGNSDHLCAGWRDWLLIDEWKQLGAFPSQPITIRWRPFCKGLKRWGMAHRWISPSFWTFPWPIRNPIPLRLPVRNTDLFRPYWVFLAAHNICSDKPCLFGNPSKSKFLYILIVKT